MSERLAFNCGTARVETPGLSEVEGESPRAGFDADPSGGPDAIAAEREPPRDLAFLGLLAFTAVLFFRPQDVVYALRPLHLAELTATFALAALIWGRMNKGLPPSRYVPELAGVVALGAVILLTAPFSVWMGGAIGTFTDLYIKVVLIFVLMVNTLTTTKRVERFTWLIVMALGYLAFRAVFDYARGVNLVENGRVQGAVGGIFRNPNDLALNMVSVMPLAIGLALRPGPSGRRAFAAGCTVFMVGATVATQSRMGTLGLVVMLAFLGFHLVRRRPGLVFAAGLAALMSLPLLPDSYLQRVYSIAKPGLDDTGSREARRILLGEAYDTFLAHPLTGVGAGQFKNYNPEGRVETWKETHNVVLQIAAELGLLGLVCFGFLVVRAFAAPIQTRRLLRRAAGGGRRGSPARRVMSEIELATLDAHRVAMAASIAGWFVCALFGAVAYNWTFYYLLALAIAPQEILAARLKAATVRSRGAIARLAA